jgi:Glycosyl hydrolases family 35
VRDCLRNGHRIQVNNFIIVLVLALSNLLSVVSSADPSRSVHVENNQLVVDGEVQPQLFGAEVQYFRLRGGYGPNVPRQKVIDLWNKALDRVVEAKMNAVSFYIPWDFHEYAEGKYDFTGSVDQDGDGNPDYPSRDVITFIKLVKAHGIKRIMVRPGPYINAEWGFLGFGAIPEWFNDKYPDSHMQTPTGLRTRLYDYLDSKFLERTQIWFSALYDQVLKQNMGPGQPILFLQLDNETNYQWHTIYDNDYSPRATARYRDFLKQEYSSLDNLNKNHHRAWADWQNVTPPLVRGENLGEDQDWYRFADYSMFTYLHEIRKMWQNIGVREPTVLFTSAESYNATQNGILPNYVYRNSPGVTGLMTVNLYPKTSEVGIPAKASPFDSFETNKVSVLMNNPFKADLDVKSATEAGANYFGQHEEWAMGPEIQGGWWRGIDVSPESRQQTYLTVIGHGLKAFFVYYFNEGYNWGVYWGHDHVQPLFDDLTNEWHVGQIPVNERSEDFWRELQNRFDKKYMVGFDVKNIMQMDISKEEVLFFDSPLDANADPRNHFSLLKKIGTQVVGPYQDFLARSVEINDDIAILKDSASHVPSPYSVLDSLLTSAEWSGDLLGCLMNANFNPRVLQGEISTNETVAAAKVLFHIDNGLAATRTTDLLKAAMANDQLIVNFLGSSTAKNLGYDSTPTSFENVVTSTSPVTLNAYIAKDGQQWVSPQTPGAQKLTIESHAPVFSYDLSQPAFKNCQPILYFGEQVVGFRCTNPQHVVKGTFVQIGASVFEDYNSNTYANLSQPDDRRLFMQMLMREKNVNPHLEFSTGAELTVAFARQDPKKELLWVTVKTGLRAPQDLFLRVNPNLLSSALNLSTAMTSLGEPKLLVTDILTNQTQQISFAEIVNQGFKLHIEGNGSSVFVLSANVGPAAQ